VVEGAHTRERAPRAGLGWEKRCLRCLGPSCWSRFCGF
jgi:hypothetical protein